MFHEYACPSDGSGYGKGQTIHAPVQLEDFGCIVEDKVARGQLRILHPNGYSFRLYSRDGLPYIKQARCTPEDLHKYPIVHMTSDVLWKVDKYDRKVHSTQHDVPCDPSDDDSVPELRIPEDYPCDSSTDDNWSDDGSSVISDVDCEENLTHPFRIFVNACIMEARQHYAQNWTKVGTKSKTILPKQPDYEKLRPHFGWVSADRVKHTLKNTTQFFKANVWYPMMHHFKSRFPFFQSSTHTRHSGICHLFQ